MDANVNQREKDDSTSLACAMVGCRCTAGKLQACPT